MTYTVENIVTKKVNTKFGEKDSYSVVCNGERYNYGFKKPAFKVGDVINFSFNEGKYGKDIEVATVRVLDPGSSAAAPTPPTPSGRPAYGPPVKPFPIPALHGDRAIIRQNALTNARELVCALLGSEETVSDDVHYVERIIALARKFEAYSAGDMDMEMALAAIKEEK